MRPPPTVAWAVLALACLGAAQGAAAQGIDLSRGGPVEVTARGGFEWHDAEQTMTATGDARAVRDDVTVLADRLVAYVRKKSPAAGAAAPPPPATPTGSDPESGQNEVYRLEADGHVRILTPTDEAVGDHAVYDMDKAVLVMTGGHLKLTTPQQVMTARDSLEYWSALHMSVGRGNAVVVSSDGRRLSADTLVGYTANPDAPGGTRAAPPRPAAPGGDVLASSGKLEKVEAYGNVEVRTQTDVVRGDRGVYVPDTGIARVLGHVRLTHGSSQINGSVADVNMKTGIARMLPGQGQRVEGLIVPSQAGGAAQPAQPAQPVQPVRPAPAGPAK
jgi:lipopolysaccharide export system protein LptA